MTQKIRIIIGTLAVGGCERHLSYVLPQLAQRGLDISVITLGGPNPLASIFKESGVTLYLGKTWYSPNFIPNPFRKIFFLLINTTRLFFHFLKDRQATTHFFLPHAYILGGLVAILTKYPGPLVMSRRSMNHYQKQYPLLAKIEHFLHKKMSCVLGNSQKVCDQLLEEGVPKKNLSLIYNGINTDAFMPPVDTKKMRASLDISEDTLVFTMLANLIPYKGHRDLIEAFASIKGRLNYPWKLILIGRDDGIQHELEQLIKHHDMDSHILFLGARNDTIPLLKMSDIFILSSHEEGFSNSILEAMGAGLPVIATDVGGNKEAVIDGETGIIVPPQNPQILGEAILKMATHKSLRETMGKAGKSRLEKEFSLNACVNRYMELYTSFKEKH